MINEKSYNVDTIVFRELYINYLEQVVIYKGKEITFTNREFQVLYFLMKHPGQVFSKRQIYMVCLFSISEM